MGGVECLCQEGKGKLVRGWERRGDGETGRRGAMGMGREEMLVQLGE
jgi:hypothetical protein